MFVLVNQKYLFNNIFCLWICLSVTADAQSCARKPSARTTLARLDKQGGKIGRDYRGRSSPKPRGVPRGSGKPGHLPGFYYRLTKTGANMGENEASLNKEGGIKEHTQG